MHYITQESRLLKKLLLEIEKRAGCQPNMTDKYSVIEKYIDEQYRDGRLGRNTIRRLWGAEKSSISFRSSTLNILAQIATYNDWNDYRRVAIAENPELENGDNGLENNTSIEDVELSLKIGEKLKLGWPPERYMEVQYNGDCEFKVLKYKGRGADLTGTYFQARWFDVESFEPRKVLKGLNKSMYSDVVGVLGNIRERFYL